MENEELPQYMRIAVSVAGRIADGQLAEGEKLSGRSKLSSEYQVSPETIRKSVQLLRDMQVVTVKEQSGVYVRSAENAKRYLQMVGEKNELRQKKQRLRALLAQKDPRLAPFLAGDGGDRRRHCARGRADRLAGAVCRASQRGPHSLCGRPGGTGGRRPVLQQNRNNMIRRVSACRKERRHTWFTTNFTRWIWRSSARI